MEQVITRFAPSPTGMLHIGNARTALINWLYCRKLQGKFILRIDDTDIERSKLEYQNGIINDLKWLGLNWDETFLQSSRLAKYEEAKQYLIKIGRLYECYESQEELAMKRQIQLKNSRPLVYDRAALHLTEDQKIKLREQGRKPHYRFKINHEAIQWQDMIKGEIKYHGNHISDPVLIRENGNMTYMLCSTVDDSEYKISHIIRGEDHVTNTAIQIQLFEALGFLPPQFGHLGLVKTKEDKISKREGGFDIQGLREKENIEPMAINSLLALMGSSKPVAAYETLQDLVKEIDITIFSSCNINYDNRDLLALNQKIISAMSFNQAIERLKQLGINEEITENFWLGVRNNLIKLKDIKIWWDVCYNPNLVENQEKDFLVLASELLPKTEFDDTTWVCWLESIKQKTDKRGKDLFLPLRMAITGLEHGPELKYLLPLIGRSEIKRRLLR